MSSLNIAIVESSEHYRNMIVKTLEEENFNVVGTAGNFGKVAEILSTNVVNLFIIDIVMPDISGMEIAHFISDQNQDILIIMMSLLEGDDYIVESVKVGIIDYLKKPFGPKKLLQSVYKAEQRAGEL